MMDKKEYAVKVFEKTALKNAKESSLSIVSSFFIKSNIIKEGIGKWIKYYVRNQPPKLNLVVWGLRRT